MAGDHARTTHFRPFAAAGLRARITLTFGVGALGVSLVLILTSVVFIRRNLLDQRERLVTERAEINAGVVADKVGNPEVDPQTLFGSLSTAGKPSVLVRDPTSGSYLPFSVDPRYGATSLPSSLANRVLQERVPAVMRFSREGETLLAVGIPLRGEDGAYFEVNQLRDIENALGSLTIPLLAAAAIITTVGATLGWYASRRVLRPLADISEVAAAISEGRLDARLAYAEWADDPDLAPIVASFNEMVAALEHRIERDARFASDVSHELRSPLTTLGASVQVLLNSRDQLPERAQLALDLLDSDLTRFTQLVEDLLEISRFDAGAVRLELEEVTIVETVRQAVRSLSGPGDGPEGIPVVADDDLEGVIMMCDKRRLVRVLANFIDNARKYGEGATAVIVERAAPPAPDEDGDGESQGETIRIIVEDAGPGVPESERERIFDRFNRGDQGGSRGRDLGVGLGLALAAEHAALHGGRVWVESRPDGMSGSRFVLEIPFVKPSEMSGITDGETFLDEVTSEHLAVSVEDAP
jgi:signal transduction histidine kinase